MHTTAMIHAKLFFDTYVPKGEGLTIVDIGAQDVNGSLRSVSPAGARYVGVDFIDGPGVDVVITDPYSLPFEDSSVDVCVSSSCFEHSEFFWLAFLEMMRVLKPHGRAYLNVPSNGKFHRYPVDCWRFYPDSGVALQNWAQRNGLDVELLESFVGNQQSSGWNDFIAVFVRSGREAERYPDRIQDSYKEFTNGRVRGREDIANFRIPSEDQRDWIQRIRGRILRLLGVRR